MRYYDSHFCCRKLMVEMLHVKTGKLKSCFLLVLLMTCFYLSSSAQVFVGGALSENTLFQAKNNPYIVFQELTVPKGITLEIEPGTLLLFSPDTRLTVKGVLKAIGTQSDSILFQMNTQIPNQSLWNGIVFDSTQTQFDPSGNYLSGSILSYASIFNSNYSVTVSGNASVLIEHTLMRKSSFGIYFTDAYNCIIRQSRILQTGFGIFIPSGIRAVNNLFEDNEIDNSFNIGLLINNSQGNVHHNTFIKNKVQNNYIGLYVGNDGNPDLGLNYFGENYISGNILEGIRIYQDSTFFIGNTVVNNGTGIALRNSSRSVIRGNCIRNNNEWAIHLTDNASENIIEKNVINSNNGGIRINLDQKGPSVTNTILYNTFYDNGDELFLIETGPQGGIHYNNLLSGNAENTFINLSSELVHAEDNWWGTIREPAIDSMIFDQLDVASFGLVQYKNPLTAPDTAAPILPPRNVVKQQAGSDVLVSWEAVPVSDVAGYIIHYGPFDGSGFPTHIDVGDITSFRISSMSVFDSVAVSAYDLDADGQNDRAEGHESEFVLAMLSPYAGPDTTTCVNSTVHLNQATAFNYEYIEWTSSGDGVFQGIHVLKTHYAPGPQDYLNGSVDLKLFVSGIGFNLYDNIRLYFTEAPLAFAGNDTSIYNDTVYSTASALSTSDMGLQWTTDGDGYFTNALVLSTDYHPGPADVIKGYVTLVLHSLSSCGEATDSIRVDLLKTYSLHGRIFADQNLVPGSRIQVYRAENNGMLEGVRSVANAADGNFLLDHLLPGEYYLYGIPPHDQFHDFVPVYYYDDVHWQYAHKLTLSEDTYDVDIRLVRRSLVLPEGEGSITGYCTAFGVQGSVCGDVVILIYDPTATYLLGWSRLEDDGTFALTSLPYGEYIIAGEKAGYERFFSQTIYLSPSNPDVNDVELKIEPYKITFRIPAGSNPTNPPVSLYPNPTEDIVFLSNIPSGHRIFYRLATPDGRIVQSGELFPAGNMATIDLAGYIRGIYIVFLFKGDEFYQSIRIIRK